jgi:hypothetical protein
VQPKRPRRKDCFATGKRRYSTANDAALALSMARSSVNRTGQANEIRYYQCPHCHAWHLTSKPMMRGEQ